MKTTRLFFLLAITFATTQLAKGQSTWGGADLINNNTNWSDPANWSAGGAPANDAVTFPDGAFPITTNVQGAVNNSVQSNTQITSLTYNSIVPHFDTTLIPAGTTLTVSGGLTISDNANITSVAIEGGGSLVAGTSGTATLLLETTGNGPLLLDLSGLTNFVFNFGATSPGNLDIANQQAPAGGTQTMNLAAGSNNITIGTLNVGNNNTRGTVTFNLGNGTNIINADTINMGESKTSGTMQFLNNAGGGLRIASHTGTGRTAINLGTEGSSGSTTAVSTGKMLFTGGTVNILAGTITMANRVARADSPGAVAVIAFDNGTVDATTINMAINTSGGGSAFATNSVGNSGILKIGSGGMSMVNEGGTAGAGTLIITNGGTVICSNNIFKTTANGVATITMAGGNLNMASLTGTIGVADANPIDNFNITNSTLTLPVAASANVIVANFNPDTATTNTINVNSMPSITTYPTTLPVITYTTGGGNLGASGILPEIALGSLPNTFGTFKGYLSNDVASLTIWLVVTNGPSVSTVEWGGGVNNHWDTNSLNWTNNGTAVKYSDGDFVTFDDLAQQNTVNITGTEKPATLEVNNSTLNYTFNGIGSISGSVGLEKDGTASLTLAETGGDNFSLGITNNAGTIVLDDANSSISGGLLIGGGATVQIGNNDANGALPSGNLDDEGTLIFDRSDSFTVATVIPGGGALVQSGSGKLTLSADNTYTGETTISNGILALTGAGSISSSAGIVVANATLDVSGVTATSMTLSSLSLANSSLNVKVGYLQTNLTVGSLTMNGTSNIINVAALPPIANYPATVTLLQASGGITGYNFVLGTLPTASPTNAGTIALSLDGTSVLLTLTAGPIGVRPSVNWSGVDVLANLSTNWSDAQNWQTPGVPTAAESVTFNNTATAGGSPFDQSGGVGSGGSVDQPNINNIVNNSLTNAALSYANTAGTFHNTQIASGKTLTVNGNLTVNGSGGTVTILGTGAAFKLGNSGNVNVEASAAPTLDMSGLDTFTATVNQIGVGFETANAGANVSGIWYLARTNKITTGVGNFSTSAALVIGGGTGSTAGNGQLYLGQSNALFVDGIVLGTSTSTGDLMEFNPILTNPVAYIRGITGDSSRVTQWSLGDDSVNINNGQSGSGLLSDFSTGTLDALVGTLIVGQGAQGNELNTSVKATFNLGAGNLDVTTLNIGVGDNGKVGGTGIGVMNVNTGTVVAGSLSLGTGGVATTSGTLNLTSNATLVVNNGITIGTGTAGGTLSVTSSTVKILNSGVLGTASAPLTTLNLDGGILQLDVDGNSGAAPIVATTVSTTANTNTINIASIANVSGTVQIPLLSYTGTDPFSALSLGTLPAGYNVSLVDDTGNSSVDLSITSTIKPKPTITSISISGTTLTLQGTNGFPAGPFVILGSTNVTTPVHLWTPVATNAFAGDGSFNLSTNIINPALPQQFFIISQ